MVHASRHSSSSSGNQVSHRWDTQLIEAVRQSKDRKVLQVWWMPALKPAYRCWFICQNSLISACLALMILTQSINIDTNPETRGRDGKREWMRRGRERPLAHTRQGAILIRGAHSLITGFSLRSTGVRPDPNPHWQVQMGFRCLPEHPPYTHPAPQTHTLPKPTPSTHTHTETHTFSLCQLYLPKASLYTNTHSRRYSQEQRSILTKWSSTFSTLFGLYNPHLLWPLTPLLSLHLSLTWVKYEVVCINLVNLFKAKASVNTS